MWSSSLGATIAWYDFTIFNLAIALIFPRLFFPDMGYLLPILVFSVGFFARPLGSLIWGIWGDRFGRKSSLVSTLYVTGLTTVAIGLLPTYAEIGVLATVLLVVARLLQTAAFGGEWAAASTMIVEHHANNSNKGLLSGVVSSGWAVANILAALMFMTVTSFGDAFFTEYGWRIPFLFSAVLLVIGVYIRRNVLETPAFIDAQQNKALTRTPVRSVLKTHWRPFLAGAMAMQLCAAWTYFIMIFGFGYMIKQELITRADLTQIQFALSWVLLFGIVIFSWLGDKIGYHRLFLATSLSSLVLFWPVVSWIAQGNAWLAMGSMIVLLCPAMAAAPAMFTGLFPSNVRQSGSGVSYNLGLMLAGLVPLMSQGIMGSTGDITNTAWLMLMLTVISVVASLKLKKYSHNV